MIRSFFGLFTLLILITLGCDKVDNPYYQNQGSADNEYGIDTSFYVGNWPDYLANYYPDFESAPANNQNVLLEDYTGHTCNNCPNAGALAHQIQDNNPGRVFVVAIHSGPGGMTSFQQYNPSNEQFYTNHTNPEGLEYGEAFEHGFNFFGNPQGTVNRRTVDGKLFDFTGTWSTRVTNELENNPIVQIQSSFNYFPETQGGYLHLKVTKSLDLASPINTVVYVVQKKEYNWQVMPDNSYKEDYEHKNKHLGSIDKRPWGIFTFGLEDGQGEEVFLDYAYKLPEDIEPENLHLIIYSYNTENHQILQVVKQEIVQ